jgi:Glyoxalase-like domain
MNSPTHGGHALSTTAPDPVVLPIPTLDHVVVNVREDMAAAAQQYRRLGFQLTPLGRHTLGSINHLAMFGTEYMELLGVPRGEGGRTDVLDWPVGLNGVVFATNDSDGLHARLAAAGAPVLPPLAFSRPVELAEGARDAAFRVVRVERAAVASGRMFFCHHLTRDVVWRDEWRRHPNGALGIEAVVISAERPEALGGTLAALFGAAALRPIVGGLRMPMGLARLDVIAPAEVARRFSAAAPSPDGRAEAMVALVLRTTDLAHAAAALAAGGVAGVVREPRRLLVPAGEAFGVTLVFHA